MIDTASNYRWGRAELAIGYALNSLRLAASGVQRDMLFISTKAGFPQEDLKQQVGRSQASPRQAEPGRGRDLGVSRGFSLRSSSSSGP